MSQVSKSSPQLYRDCLRLVNHIAGRSSKGRKLRTIVRGEFKRNSVQTDPVVIEGLKSNAIKALANYLMLESAQKDPRFKMTSNNFTKRESDGLKDINSSRFDANKSDSGVSS